MVIIKSTSVNIFRSMHIFCDKFAVYVVDVTMAVTRSNLLSKEREAQSII